MHTTSINIGNGKQKFFRYMGGEDSHRFYHLDRKIGCKIDMPEIDDYIDYERSILFADYDRLPSGFSDWESHREYTKFKYGHIGFVFESSSGKTKIAFVLEGIHLSDRIKTDTLKKLIQDDMDGVGLKHNDLSRSFMHPRFFSAFGSFIRSADPIKPVRDHQVKYITLPNAILSDYPEPIREIVTHIASFGWKSTAGVDCPQRYIADAFGRSQSTVSVNMQDAKNDGVIRCVDSSVSVGRKAMTFAISTALYSAIVAWSCIGSLTSGGYPKNLYRAPVLDLEDGHWYEGLWRATNHFHDESSFMDWAFSESRDPQKHHERMAMASRAWNNHLA